MLHFAGCILANLYFVHIAHPDLHSSYANIPATDPSIFNFMTFSFDLLQQYTVYSSILYMHERACASGAGKSFCMSTVEFW